MYIQDIVCISSAGADLSSAFNHLFTHQFSLRDVWFADMNAKHLCQHVYVCPPSVVQEMWKLAQRAPYKGQDVSIHFTHVLTSQLSSLQQDEYYSQDIDVLMGSSRGVSDLLEDVILQCVQTPERVAVKSSPYTTGSVIAAYLSRTLKLEGGYACVSSACASSLMAIGMAYAQIKSGMVKHVLAGGVECPITISVLKMLQCAGVLAQNLPKINSCTQNIPLQSFGQNRSGMVLAEGGGLVRLSASKQTSSLGKICGVATCREEAGLCGISRDGQSLQRALHQACQHAKWDVDQIDLIAVHGAGTVAGDRAEIKALQTIFAHTTQKPHLLITKWATGHTLGASGVLQLGFALQASLQQRVPVPPYPLDVQIEKFIAAAKSSPIRRIGVVSLGFGGISVVLLVESYMHNKTFVHLM